jgi:hypothetical protein
MCSMLQLSIPFDLSHFPGSNNMSIFNIEFLITFVYLLVRKHVIDAYPIYNYSFPDMYVK